LICGWGVAFCSAKELWICKPILARVHSIDRDCLVGAHHKRSQQKDKDGTRKSRRLSNAAACIHTPVVSVWPAVIRVGSVIRRSVVPVVIGPAARGQRERKRRRSKGGVGGCRAWVPTIVPMIVSVMVPTVMAVSVRRLSRSWWHSEERLMRWSRGRCQR
jgi:hypothetical protein